MHTDRKIGFAMGILLIGVVAALFFRNEPLLPPDVPAVRRERLLNERLRERDVAVYLDESQDSLQDSEDTIEQPSWTLRDVLRNMDQRNRSLPSPVPSWNRKSESVIDGRPAMSLDGYRAANATSSQSILNPAETAAAPDSKPPERVDPLPPLFPSTLPSPMPDDVAPVMPPEDSIPENFEEYVVRYGDTLSGIAQKLLGSQSRYQEIFDANRDRMASPDRLEVGKPIRIPRLAGEPPKSL